VQFEGGGRERQAETETLRARVGVPAPEEPGTEIGQIGGRDPRPVVAHRDDDLLRPFEFRRQGHGRPGGRVRRGVLEQVPDHLREEDGIADRDQTRSNVHDESMRRK
jgi:hypothetical protein